MYIGHLPPSVSCRRLWLFGLGCAPGVLAFVVLAARFVVLPFASLTVILAWVVVVALNIYYL